MQFLIGEPASRLLPWLTQQVKDEQGLEIQTFIFVRYVLKSHELPGQIRSTKEVGDELFIQLTPQMIEDGELERMLRAISDDNEGLGLTSTVFVRRPKNSDCVPSAAPAHLFLLDLVQPPTQENEVRLQQGLKERLGLSSGAVVVSSPQGMHFYSDKLFSLSDWLGLCGKSLLMNHPERGEVLVDERHIGHSLIPFPPIADASPFDSQPVEIALFSTLRLNAVGGKPEPRILAIF